MHIKFAYSTLVNICISSIWLFCGCQTTQGVVIKDSPLLLEQTRKVIISVIGEPRGISENGRDIYSNYFDKKEVPLLSDEMPINRYFTFVSIRGDRRPYDIYVDVVKEKKISEKRYEEDDHDLVLAKRIGSKIKHMLNQSRDKRNVIDDFRPY